MSMKFDELTKSMTPSVTRHRVLKKFGVGLAGMALACFGLASGTLAQTSVVCDPAGDAVFGDGNGGPALPAWLDITHAVVADDTQGNIIFTLTVNAPIPTVPAWNPVNGGGQLTWGWRMIDHLANLKPVKNGCLGANGTVLPGAYYMDLFWSVRTSSFEASLVDNTLCTKVLIPFSFSADRTQIIMVVAKSLLANPALIPDPDNFEYVATTVTWKSNSTGNRSYSHVDWAPDDDSSGATRLATYSSSSNTSFLCP